MFARVQFMAMAPAVLVVCSSSLVQASEREYPMHCQGAHVDSTFSGLLRPSVSIAQHPVTADSLHSML